MASINFQSEEFLLELDYYLKNLNIISKLEKYNKLGYYDNYFFLQNTDEEYFIPVKRWWYGLSRFNTTKSLNVFYKKLFLFVREMLKVFKDSNDFKNKNIAKENVLIIFESIKSAKKTINILNIIYKDDEQFKSELNNVREYINEECRHLTNVIYLEPEKKKQLEKKKKRKRKK